jgi:DNA-binding MarR family transcriptional regulator
MEIESIKTCPYRDSKLGYLICKISPGGMPVLQNGSYMETGLTTKEICQKCPIPDVSLQVNCVNLDVGKRHRVIALESLGSRPNYQFQVAEININCRVVGFRNPEDYKEKCSLDCLCFRPVHKNISNENQISIDRFDALSATDRALRQAVLAILYQYHARHPERFDYFDVTPDFIGECLGITIQDVVRVVAPMEEEGEVTTKRYAHDLHFRYVTIRSKGIRMIDEEPLFERFNTAQVRSEMTFNAPVYNAAGIVEGNQQISKNDQTK